MIKRVIIGAAGLGALTLALTGCAGQGSSLGAATPSGSAGTATALAATSTGTQGSAPTSANTTSTSQNTAGAAKYGVPNKPGVSCTNQLNYAGDDRDNATINSIGEQTGYCPPIPVKPGVSCTNQIDYGSDGRSNAEINSIGEQTGYCPFPQHS